MIRPVRDPISLLCTPQGRSFLSPQRRLFNFVGTLQIFLNSSARAFFEAVLLGLLKKTFFPKRTGKGIGGPPGFDGQCEAPSSPRACSRTSSGETGVGVLGAANSAQWGHFCRTNLSPHGVFWWPGDGSRFLGNSTLLYVNDIPARRTFSFFCFFFFLFFFFFFFCFFFFFFLRLRPVPSRELRKRAFSWEITLILLSEDSMISVFQVLICSCCPPFRSWLLSGCLPWNEDSGFTTPFRWEP